MWFLGFVQGRELESTTQPMVGNRESGERRCGCGRRCLFGGLICRNRRFGLRRSYRLCNPVRCFCSVMVSTFTMIGFVHRQRWMWGSSPPNLPAPWSGRSSKQGKGCRVCWQCTKMPRAALMHEPWPMRMHWVVRAGVLQTTFAETETDLFGEQAVLCGGVTSWSEWAGKPSWRLDTTRKWPISSVYMNSNSSSICFTRAVLNECIAM